LQIYLQKQNRPTFLPNGFGKLWKWYWQNL